MICPNYKNKDVFREFNELIEALGGDPMTEEEFKSSALRNLRTGLNFSAMEKAYELWHKTEGNILSAIDEARRNSKLDKRIMLLPPKHLTAKEQEIQRRNLIYHIKNYYRYNEAFIETCYGFIKSLQLKIREINKFKYHNYDRGDYVSDDMRRQMDRDMNRFLSPYEKRLLDNTNPYHIGYGNYILNIKVDAQKALNRYIEDYLLIIDTYSLDTLRSEAARLGINDDINADVMHYINPKKLEEIRRQIIKKTDYYTEQELEEALKFLQELENERESNAYVECCIRWMKAGMINLPRDNEKVRKLFDYTRKHRVDIQKFKTPYDLLRYQIERERYTPRESGINPLDYDGITFDHEETLSDGSVVQIYNVLDDDIGQQSVCQMLADTNPIKDNNDVVEFSPWCTSTFNYNKKTGKASASTSAKGYWKNTYTYAKKQIAFFNGFPIAFNASSHKHVEWWNMHDKSGDKLTIDYIYSRKNALYINTNPDASSMPDVLVYTFGPYNVFVNENYIIRLEYNTVNARVSRFSDVFRVIFNNDPEHSLTMTALGDNQYTLDVALRFEQYLCRIFVHEANNQLISGSVRIIGVFTDKKYSLPDDLYNVIIKNIPQRPLIDFNDVLSDKHIPERFIELAKTILEAIRLTFLTSLESKDIIKLYELFILKEQQETYKKVVQRAITQQNYIAYIGGLNIGGFVQPAIQLLPQQHDYDALSLTEYQISEETIETAEDLLDQEIALAMFKTYVHMPVNKDLNRKLKKILKKFHFEVLEKDLQAVFGNDVFGEFDFLLKLIYLNKEENQDLISLPEEFAHAFIKMMGAVYHRQNNRSGNNLVTKEYSELVDLMKGTDFYKYVYELYKDDPAYQYENGRPAENKIVEEALGKALATAIINKHHERENQNIFQKVWQWFKDQWSKLKTRWFKSNDDITDLQKGLNDIADSILDGTYYVKHLKKLDDTGYKKQEYYKTIKDAIKSKNYIPLRIMQALSDLRCIISGSLAYRLLGDMYRDKIDSLHDIDVMIPSDVHGMNLLMFNPHYNNNVLYTIDQILDIINSNFPQASELLNNIKLDVLNYHLMYAYTVNNCHSLIFNVMSCEDESLVQRFMSMTGNFTQRLHNFTDEERSKMYLIDLFFNDDTVPNSVHRDDLYNITLADYTVPYAAKLKTSRAKDLYDYQRFHPYHRKVHTGIGDTTTILYDNRADEYMFPITDDLDTNIRSCLAICKKLLKKFPNLRVEVISENELPEGIEANAFILNGTIYLVRGRVTGKDTIEEFMHAVVYTIFEGNYQLYQDLLEEAKNVFSGLYEKIKNQYTDEKGFTESDREQELLAKVLAKYVHKKLNTKDAGVKGYVAKVLNFFTKLVQNLYKKNLKLNEITNMTLEELADHISTDNIKIKTLTEDNVRFSLSELDVIGSLTDRIKVLYDAYNKIQNKTVSGLRILNEIYELYTKIRSNQTYQSVVDFLDYAENRLVSYVKTDEGDITDEKDQYNTRTFYGYLMYQKNQPEPFVNCTPEILVNMYKYGIGFFKDVCDKYLIIGTFEGIDNEIKEIIEDDLRRVDGIIKNYIMPLWREAIAIVADREIDKIIDQQVITGNPQDREDMKVVVKDYLHKNAMYGDIKNWLEFLYNFGHSNSPIIKLAFHLIQEAETVAGIEANKINLKLTKLFRDAQTSFHFGGRYRLFGKINPGWQSMFMEFDNDGIPTGYFIRDINYGQYEKDLQQFILELNKLFDDAFGHHYSVDEELGITINSATGEDALDEEWDGKYVQYLKAIEIFKCQRANRRYTLRYYTERLSRPYRGSFDPDDVDDLSKFGHGLSPRTLAEYNRILSNINYYLNLCTDPITNVVKKENLTEQEKKNLDSWENELDKLQNPYIFKDGSYGLKTGEELQMAFEIKAWNKWVGKQTRTNVDLDGFKQAENEAKQKSAAENNPQILYDFYKYNCDFGINLDFINQTIGMFDRRETGNRFAIHAQMLKDGLFGLLKTIPNNRYKRDLKAFENRPAFWVQCKELDQLIEDGKVKQTKECAEMIDANFVFEEILYRDEHGFAIDSNGNLVLPQDEKNHKDLLTYREYLINYYADIIINNPNRTLFNLLDETGNPMVFTGNVYEIKDFLRKNMFSYTKTRSTKDGVVIEQSPLSIFVVMKPKNQTFYNKRTGRIENTSEYIPKGRFSSKENISNDESKLIYNTYYDNKAKQAELPKREFYDNSKNFNKITGKYKDLYDALIETMKEMLKKYSTNSTFNYMLPQIESLSTQILSILRRSGFKNTAKAFMDSMSTIEENDENMRSSNLLIPRPDGTVGTDVPLKFIHRLKHPERISSDIVGAVLAFVEMAINYELKIKIQALLELFSYNLDYENRRMLHATEQGDIEPIPAKNQEKSYKEMLDINLYGNQWKSVDSSGNVSDQGRALVFAKKTIRKISRLETIQMLGVNIFSVLVGGGDALTRFTKETLNHKYLTVRDALTAIYGVLTRLPAAILNIGNPIPNTKLAALLHNFGIAKNYEAVFSDTRKGRLRRIIGNMLMGAFSIIDWFVNSLLLRAHMNHVRFYDGGEFATGFYTKWQLERMFLEKYGQTLSNKIKGGLTWTMLTTTLWDAYKTKAGIVSIKTYIDRHGNEQSYEPYITKDVLTHVRTKTMLRGALINGMNPDNDIPRWKVNPFSAPIFALRAFILLQWLHYFAGRVENIPRSFEYIDTPTFFLNREHRSKVLVKKNLTSDEKNRRTAWNYETGTPEDQVGIGLYRAAVRLVNVLYRTITFNFNKLKGVLKLSNVEKYAILSAFTYISLTALLGWSWTNFHDYVKQQFINKPQSRELAAPLNLFNPTEWSTFIYDKWIGDNYWLMAADNIMFRTFESNISTASPFLAYDLLTSITALKSGLDNHIAPIQLLGDAFGLGGINDEVVLSGKYKYFTKKLRTLYSAIGPMNNLITFFTYNGIESNQRWYLNKFGGLVEFFGYDIDGKLNKNSGKSSNKKNNRGGSVGRGGSSTRGGSRKRGGSNSRF